MTNKTYDIRTDLDPQALSEVGLLVYEAWVNFAMGATSLGGFKIANPTGRYAASIEYRQTGQSSITIATDETLAPEGAFLEEGTKAIDMLGPNSPWVGRRIPMHRGQAGSFGSKGNTIPEMPKTLAAARRKKHIWAEARATSTPDRPIMVPKSRSGVDPGKQNTSNTGPAWTIPAMPAYSPAAHLSDLIRAETKRRGGMIL